jgi:hypothetical protein
VTVNLNNDGPANLASHANRTVRTTGAGQAANFENVTGGGRRRPDHRQPPRPMS